MTERALSLRALRVVKRMAADGFALFDTAIGRCAIAWGERGIVGLQLPEAREAATRARITRRFPEAREAAPQSDVREVIDSIVALLQGEPVDLRGVPLDMAGVPPFNQRVYEVARTIPAGATLSYGAIAKRLGEPNAAREVGQALSRNPFAIVVPCHRVVAAGGKPGGFSASGGARTKLRMLAIEGAEAGGARALFDAQPFVASPRQSLAEVTDAASRSAGEST
jgi:methylated-DNA-[protein]-cysteine S-methyltransferase